MRRVNSFWIDQSEGQIIFIMPAPKAAEQPKPAPQMPAMPNIAEMMKAMQGAGGPQALLNKLGGGDIDINKLLPPNMRPPAPQPTAKPAENAQPAPPLKPAPTSVQQLEGQVASLSDCIKRISGVSFPNKMKRQKTDD